MERRGVNHNRLYVKVCQWGEAPLKQSPGYTNFIVEYVPFLCIKQIYFKKMNKCTRMFECNLIIWQPPKHFGHSCGHLQAGKNESTFTIVMCQKQSTVKIM